MCEGDRCDVPGRCMGGRSDYSTPTRTYCDCNGRTYGGGRHPYARIAHEGACDERDAANAARTPKLKLMRETTYPGESE